MKASLVLTRLLWAEHAMWTGALGLVLRSDPASLLAHSKSVKLGCSSVELRKLGT